MPNKDLINLLFNKQEDEDIFYFNDHLLEELNNKIENNNEMLNFFIDRKVHPKLRKNLKKIIQQLEKLVDEYHRRENKLYYKNGVADGVNLILSLLSFK